MTTQLLARPRRIGGGPPKQLYECPQNSVIGIPAKLAPFSSTPLTVSTLTRWTPLRDGKTLKADAAAGFVDVKDHTINRRLEWPSLLEGFSDLVTGHTAKPMQGGKIAVVGASDSIASFWGRPYTSPHPLGGKVTGATANGIGTSYRCFDRERSVDFDDMIKLEMDDDLLYGTSGALVIDGSSNILGMVSVLDIGCLPNAAGDDCLRDEDGKIVDAYFTPVGYAAKAANIKAALQFDHWVGSETIPLRGGFERVAGSEDTAPQLKGWAYDPLNPTATLPIDVELNGTQQGALTANQSPSASNTINLETIDGVSGNHGFTWTIPSAYRTGDPTWQVYALDQVTDTTENPAIRRLLPELKAATEWTVSDCAVELLKDYEECYAYPYDDDDPSEPRKRLTQWVDGATIGCGHLIKEREWGREWKKFEDGTSTLSEAEQVDLFQKDLDEHTDIIRQHVKIPISQQWFDALALFAYNLGGPKFASSTVRKKLQDPPQRGNHPNLEEALKVWRGKWIKKDGKEEEVYVVEEGLIRRRRDEWALLDQGVCTRTEYNN